MKKLIFAVILSVYTLWAYAEIQVQINPSPVTIDENFQLTLTQADTQSGGVPDLSALQKDFIILGTSRQISYSVINGQSSTTSQWIVTLKPLKTGVLSIPAIKMGAEESSPMTINVEAAGTKQENTDLDNQDLLLQTSVDQSNLYVNQEIIYTVKIFNSKRLLDAEYEAPKSENALIIPLDESKRYQMVQNNTSYVVEEQKYAIFPQKSGELSITSPTFTALVYEINPQRLKVSDKETKLTVKPIPAQYQGSWLPAKEIKLSEQYESTNQSLSQGSTLVRTVVLEGAGLPAQLLPSLEFKGSDIFSVYPEKGTDRNQIIQGELIGRTEFKVTYLFNKPGKIAIPEVRVPWFNTHTGKEEVAILAPRSIEVTANASSGNTLPPSSAQSLDKKSSSVNLATSVPLEHVTSFWPWLVAAFFALAWVFTLLLGSRKKTNNLLGNKLYKKALEELKIACDQSNPQRARDALLKWASIQWPDAVVLNLNELAQLTRDGQLKKQLALLSQALYKKQNANWQGEELYRAVMGVKMNKSATTAKVPILPPINPR